MSLYTPRVDLMVRPDLTRSPVWTDVTADVFHGPGVRVGRGRLNESTGLSPSTCELSFKNDTGKYSPRNPVSPFYGSLGRNTPLRVGVGTPPLGASLYTTVDGTALVAPTVTPTQSGYLFAAYGMRPQGNITVPAALAAGTEREGPLSTWRAGIKVVSAGGATGDLTATASVTATEHVGLQLFVPGASLVAWYSAIDTGPAATVINPSGWVAGDSLVAIGGYSTDPGDRLAPPRLASVEADQWTLITDTGPRNGLRIAAWTCTPQLDPFVGSVVLEADGDAAGETYFVLGHTRTSVAWSARFVGEVSDWPTDWPVSESVVTTEVTASGVSRRLVTASQEYGAMARELTDTEGVIAYWPGEDETDSTQVASAFSGHPPGVVAGKPQFGADDTFPGARALGTWEKAGFRGVVPAHAPPAQLYDASLLVKIPTAGTTNAVNLMQLSFADGTLGRVTVEYITGGELRLRAYSTTNSVLLSSTTSGAGMLGALRWISVQVFPFGADVAVSLFVFDVPPVGVKAEILGASVSANATATTMGVLRYASAGLESDLDAEITGPVVLGHLMVADRELYDEALHRAVAGNWGETVHDRVLRVARQYGGVPPYVQFNAASSRTGHDKGNTLLALLAESEAVDLGQLYEPRGRVGLAYRTRQSWSQSDITAVSATYGNETSGLTAPLVSVDDDQATRNDVTVTRVGGSTARREVTVGRMSVQPPPAGVGRYKEEYTINAAADSELADHAGLRAAVGTWDEARYPRVRIDMAKLSTATRKIVAGMDVGTGLRLLNLPVWLPPEDPSLLVTGYMETLTPFEWVIDFHTVPIGPWRAANLAFVGRARLGSATSTLNVALNTTETLVSVNHGTGAVWTTDSADRPFDILIGGERMTVTGVTAPGGTIQTFTVTRSVNAVVKAHTVGGAVTVADRFLLGME